MVENSVNSYGDNQQAYKCCIYGSIWKKMIQLVLIDYDD